ncbi:MAG: TRAP transporter TatT component family protein [Nitrospinota bacterium]
MKQLAVRSTAAIIEDTFAAFNEEEDPVLAEAAAASNLKLLEGLLKADPANRKLLLLAARGFGGYAFAFAEEDDLQRAARLYLRGRAHGLRLLRLHGFSPPPRLEQFQQGVKDLGRGAVPAIFWTAYNWANWIKLNQSSPRALADLPRVVAMMQRVLELDEGYFYGGAHVFLGSYYGGRPKIAGGDVAAAKRHLARATELSGGKFLINWVFYARYFAVPAQDREAYVKLLKKVTEAPAGVFPAERLANTIARRRAARMLAEVDEYF